MDVFLNSSVTILNLQEKEVHNGVKKWRKVKWSKQQADFMIIFRVPCVPKKRPPRCDKKQLSKMLSKMCEKL